MNACWIIGIGGSAGSHLPLCTVLEQMPADFPGSFLITIHRHAHSEDLLSDVLDKRTKIAVASAEDGLRVDPGFAYIAPPDRHLLVVDGHLRLSAGARENRARPSIDVMLRSIAVNCSPGAIGVVLSGFLNDGADGLRAIKACGGRAIVQDPTEAQYPEMPEMAARATVLDHVLPAKDIAHTIDQTVRVDPASLPHTKCPAEIQAEVDIALGKRLSIATENELGTHSNVTCPDCGGVLWYMPFEAPTRLRCHTGHAFTADVLAQVQSEKVEEAMWIAMRTLRERAQMLRNLADRASEASARKDWTERAEEADAHANAVAKSLLSIGARGKS